MATIHHTTARLVVLVRRVLKPAAGDKDGRGCVTATWRLPDEAAARRGVFATAELRWRVLPR
jgi:hypothetical protein